MVYLAEHPAIPSPTRHAQGSPWSRSAVVHRFIPSR